jgi:hypothetical protein
MRFKEDIMQSLRLSRAWLVCALLTSLLLATVTVAANAKSGTTFTGYFDLSGVQRQGDVVHVTLHLKLFNHGDTDLKGTIVTLLDSAPTMTLVGNFQPVKVWKRQQFVEMTQDFTVSKVEFQTWRIAPAQPNLFILFKDSSGNVVQQSARVSRRPFAARKQ